MAHDVFVCHSAEDRTIAQGACARLEDSGIRCWIAPRNALAGIPYGRQLIDAIANTSIVLLILSSQTNESEHVLSELELAYNRNKIILPFRIEDVQPSGDLEYYIKRVHWLDAVEPPFEARLDELVDRVEGILATLHPASGAETESTSAQTAPSTSQSPIVEPASTQKVRLSVTTSAGGTVVAPGTLVDFSYIPLTDQIDDEEVRFVDGEGAGKIAAIVERVRGASAIAGKCAVPESVPGSKLHMKVTTWDKEGTAFSGVAMKPVTVAAAAANVAAKVQIPQSRLVFIGAAAAVVIIALVGYAVLRPGGGELPATNPSPSTRYVTRIKLPPRARDPLPADQKWTSFASFPGLYKAAVDCHQVSSDERTVGYRVFNDYEADAYAYFGTGATPETTDAWNGRLTFTHGASRIFYATIPGKCGEQVYYWLRTIRFAKDSGSAVSGTDPKHGET